MTKPPSIQRREQSFAFALLLASTFISGTGTAITLVAIPWHIVAIGGSTTNISVYFIVSYAVSALLLPRFSVRIDHHPRKRVSQALSCAGFSLMLGAALVGSFQKLPIAAMVGVAMMSLVLRTLDQVNRMAFAQELLPADRYRSISQWMELVRHAITFAAGGATVLMLESWSITHVLFLDAATYLLALILVHFISSSYSAQRRASAASSQPLREVAHILLADRRLLIVLLATLAPYVAVIVQNTIYPAHFKIFLGASAEEYAAVSVIYGLGAMAATGLGRLRDWGVGRDAIFRGAILGYGGAVLALLVIPAVSVTLGATFVLALCHAVIRIERNTLIMHAVAPEYMGRANGLFEATATLAMTVLTLLAGLLVDHVSVASAWFLIIGLLGIAGFGMVVVSTRHISEHPRPVLH